MFTATPKPRRHQVFSPALYPVAQAHAADLYRRAQASNRHRASRPAGRNGVRTPARSVSTWIAQAIGRPATA